MTGRVALQRSIARARPGVKCLHCGHSVIEHGPSGWWAGSARDVMPAADPACAVSVCDCVWFVQPGWACWCRAVHLAAVSYIGRATA